MKLFLKVHHSDLVVTSGASHGLHLILSTLIDFEGVIIIYEATYMIALESFAQFPMKIVTGKTFKNYMYIFFKTINKIHLIFKSHWQKMELTPKYWSKNSRKTVSNQNQNYFLAFITQFQLITIQHQFCLLNKWTRNWLKLQENMILWLFAMMFTIYLWVLNSN